MPVVDAPARIADVPVYLNGVGTAKARNTVTVRAQVDGKILSINFKEGQDVKKGDVLAQIDPATYQAQLDQAIAKKALDEAQLANAKRDLERYAKLHARSSVAQKTIDTQRALVAQLEAQIKLDDAAIANAKAYPRLHHHRRRRSTAAPASAWSTRATSCAPRRRRHRRDHRGPADRRPLHAAAAAAGPGQRGAAPGVP